MQKELDEEEVKQEEDWGNPPSPDTPENRRKAIKAQIILGFSIYRNFNTWYSLLDKI